MLAKNRFKTTSTMFRNGKLSLHNFVLFKFYYICNSLSWYCLINFMYDSSLLFIFIVVMNLYVKLLINVGWINSIGHCMQLDIILIPKFTLALILKVTLKMGCFR